MNSLSLWNWPKKLWKDSEIHTIHHRYHKLHLHSQLFWSELDRLHQPLEQTDSHHSALLLEEGHEEVHLPLEPQLAGMVWQLPAVAHQGGQGVCRPSLPHPPHQVIPSCGLVAVRVGSMALRVHQHCDWLKEKATIVENNFALESQELARHFRSCVHWTVFHWYFADNMIYLYRGHFVVHCCTVIPAMVQRLRFSINVQHLRSE